MNLSEVFDSAANLGVVAKKWFATVEARFKAAGITTVKSTGINAAASLLAPAALIAQLIKLERLPTDRALRVLVMSDDPVAIMDEGVWISFAADLAGVLPIEFYSTCTLVIHSDHFEPMRKLGLPGYRTIEPITAQIQDWDLAVWIHPAIETGKCDGLVDLVAALATRAVPTYSCMYNELDALIQTHGLASRGFEFSWLNASVADAHLGKASVNKFGIATAEIGIEGGWGAVITRVQKASVPFNASDWAAIKVAMSLYRLEGSTSGIWSLGEVLAGVSFNQSRPVGLIGNIAVDPVTGLLLSQCPTTKALTVVGHLWSEMLRSMPTSNYALVAWAAKVKLSFNSYLTKETKKRSECIELLDDAFRAGMVEAGIALARGYESIGTAAAQEQAHKLYVSIGTDHPMSAYYLAHKHLASGEQVEFAQLMNVAVSAGYPPAMTDFGCVLKDCGNLEGAEDLFFRAMDAGDAEGAFRLGELMINAGAYAEALIILRTAWEKHHPDALNTAHWLVTEMLKHGLGKAGKLKRELKDVQYCISKRTRHENHREREGA